MNNKLTTLQRIHLGHVAKKFGVSISLVYAIKKKQIWQHIHKSENAEQK